MAFRVLITDPPYGTVVRESIEKLAAQSLTAALVYCVLCTFTQDFEDDLLLGVCPSTPKLALICNLSEGEVTTAIATISRSGLVPDLA